MALYTLTFDLLGSFSGAVPQLSVLYGDTELSVISASASSQTLSIQIDTNSQPFESTFLRFYMHADTGENTDTLEVNNIQIDGNALVVANFSTEIVCMEMKMTMS